MLLAWPSHDDEGVPVIDETLLEAEDKMDKAIQVAKDDFATIRTGRANAQP